VKLGRLFFLFSVSIFSALAAAAPPAGDVLAGVPAWFEPTPNNIFAARSNGGLVNVDSHTMAFRANGKTDRLEWIGAEAARLSGAAFNGAYTDYHVGAPSAWRTQVPHFARVEARGLYAGIDAVYYWNAGQFEFDLQVAPGRDVSQIRLHASSTAVPQADGSLLAGQFRLRPPVAYQETVSGRVNVPAQYRLDQGDIGFAIGSYDRSLPLVIDPLVFVGFFGGDQYGRANAIATTPDGITYIVGGASSETTIPSSAPEQELPAGAGDAFAAGVLFGWHAGASVRDQLRYGVCAAAANLSDETCTGGLKSLKECLAIGDKYGFRS